MHELAARLARGEEAAFAELYDECADRLHRWLAVRLRSRELASDVLQTTFLRAVLNRKRFGRVENPAAYLFQIARNEAVRAGQKSRRFEKQIQVDVSQPATGDRPSDEAEAAAMALARLKDDDREIVELKIYAGLTFREIAEVTGSPQGTVATRYRRALESLRPWLTRQFQ